MEWIVFGLLQGCKNQENAGFNLFPHSLFSTSSRFGPQVASRLNRERRERSLYLCYATVTPHLRPCSWISHGSPADRFKVSCCRSIGRASAHSQATPPRSIAHCQFLLPRLIREAGLGTRQISWCLSISRARENSTIVATWSLRSSVHDLSSRSRVHPLSVCLG